MAALGPEFRIPESRAPLRRLAGPWRSWGVQQSDLLRHQLATLQERHARERAREREMSALERRAAAASAAATAAARATRDANARCTALMAAGQNEQRELRRRAKEEVTLNVPWRKWAKKFWN